MGNVINAITSGGPLRIYKQQHDPTDQGKRSDGWRNKMPVCGLNMHSKEVERLSRRRKGDARVCEHYDAQSYQKDCDDGFCVHLTAALFGLFFSGHRAIARLRNCFLVRFNSAVAADAATLGVGNLMGAPDK